MASSTLAHRLKQDLLPAMLLMLAIYRELPIIILRSNSNHIANPPVLHPRLEKEILRQTLAGPTDFAADPPPALPSLLATATGTVLDIGPRTGVQLTHFTPAITSIDRIYGAEPGDEFHAELAANAAKAGLGEKYRILGCGAELASLLPALRTEGVLASKATEGGEKGGDPEDQGVFDTIISDRVLCSVPHPRATIAGLYALLKPGGRLIVCEHVANAWQRPGGSAFARLLQAFYMSLGWSFFCGGCHLDRDTGRVLREAGRWESVTLEVVDGATALPHVLGVLVKGE
ncbi:hypothetical protein LTR04_001748 [Oleoguttula sp. CCFEE 6159]|nr:hypothetical protein LTR04_001748 [Oleoguttula sp. CCFEE 6159]